MINEVYLSNFQSHKDTHIRLDKGVNVFSGNSDCGKSAIMRGIIWAITNDLQGDYFISNWAKNKKGKIESECKVVIDSVSRVKGKDYNGYTDGDSKYEALRGAVPEEIAKKFNIDKVNIQRQLDGPFLLSNTPGEVAKYVNELVNLTEIDEALSWVASQQREANSEIKICEKGISQIELIDQAKIDKANNMLKELSKLDSEISTKREAYEQLEDQLGKLERFKVHDTGRAEVAVQSLGRVLDDGKQLGKLFAVLSNGLRNIEKLKKQSSVPDINLKALERAKRLLDSSNDEYKFLSSNIQRLEKEINRKKDSEVDLPELEKELEKMVCPLCGRRGCDC